MKLCNGCGLSKNETDFHKDKYRKDGLRNRCKSCASKRQSKTRSTPARKESMNAYARSYYADHADAKRERQRVWARKHALTKREKNQRRRALQKNVSVELVQNLVVFCRDNWVCGICKTAVDPKLEYPNVNSKSLDHIIPLSKGGQHSYDNVQLAHLSCNRRKSARL